MPGSTLLRDAASRDDAQGFWLLSMSLRVPAHVHAVADFYRQALADAGLKLTEDRTAHGDDAVVTTTLRGRLPGVHGFVSAEQRPPELSTRVRVLWRVWD